MEVHLTPDQQAYIRSAIEAGRLRRAEDAVEEALLLWEERERARAEILAAVDRAERSLADGDGQDITEQAMRDLAARVKERERRRSAVERSAYNLATLPITRARMLALRLPGAARTSQWGASWATRDWTPGCLNPSGKWKRRGAAGRTAASGVTGVGAGGLASARGRPMVAAALTNARLAVRAP